MLIVKEVVIHDKRWKVEFRSFLDVNCGPLCRFKLDMTCLDNTKKSIQFFNVGSYYHVVFDFSDQDYKNSTKSLTNIKLKIINYLVYES